MKWINVCSFRKYRYRRLSSIEDGVSTSLNDDEDDEEIFSSDNMELHHLGKKNGSAEHSRSQSSLIPIYEKLVERPIHKGETLRSISLKYKIPVSFKFIFVIY